MARTQQTTTTKPSMLARLTGGRHGHVTQKTTTTRTTAETGQHHHNHNHHHHNHKHTAAAFSTHDRTGAGVGQHSQQQQHHHHHQRRPSFGDKVSGAMLRLKGTLLRRPGLKAAGTRRERGTDGRGARRSRR